LYLFFSAIDKERGVMLTPLEGGGGGLNIGVGLFFVTDNEYGIGTSRRRTGVPIDMVDNMNGGFSTGAISAIITPVVLPT